MIFVAIFTFGIGYLILAPATFDPRLMAPNLERTLLSVQAIFLTSLVGVIYYYGIPMAKNLQGIILGYGLCVGTTLVTLAIRSFAGPSFNAAWILIQPLAYWASLFVWFVALWKYSPNPVVAVGTETDYHAFASATKSRIGERGRISEGRPAHDATCFISRWESSFFSFCMCWRGGVHRWRAVLRLSWRLARH